MRTADAKGSRKRIVKVVDSRARSASHYSILGCFGIDFARVVAARLSASPSCVGEKDARRRAVMKRLREILLGVLVATMVAACAFAQKNGNDNRPPKGNEKIVERPKEKPPSNSNSNTNKKKPD
jgi:hypothetical protein